MIWLFMLYVETLRLKTMFLTVYVCKAIGFLIKCEIFTINVKISSVNYSYGTFLVQNGFLIKIVACTFCGKKKNISEK